MNRVITYQLLDSELRNYRELPFQDIRQLIGEKSTRQVRGDDGIDYDLSIQVEWSHHDNSDIRVTGYIAESKWGSPHDALDETIIIPNPYRTE